MCDFIKERLDRYKFMATAKLILKATVTMIPFKFVKMIRVFPKIYEKV